jgi:hypothetical protein
MIESISSCSTFIPNLFFYDGNNIKANSTSFFSPSSSIKWFLPDVLFVQALKKTCGSPKSVDLVFYLSTMTMVFLFSQ